MSITVLALNAVFTVFVMLFLMYLIFKVEERRAKCGLVALIYAIAVVWVLVMTVELHSSL
jgi:hypothetical protein